MSAVRGKTRASDSSLCVVKTYATETAQWAWTVVCQCGNARLLLVGDYAARCHSCGAYHSRDAYQRASDSARKKAAFDDLPIAKTESMMPSMRSLTQKVPMVLGANGQVRPVSPHIMEMYKKCLPLVRPKLTGKPIEHKRRAKLLSVSGGQLL